MRPRRRSRVKPALAPRGGLLFSQGALIRLRLDGLHLGGTGHLPELSPPGPPAWAFLSASALHSLDVVLVDRIRLAGVPLHLLFGLSLATITVAGLSKSAA
jgi:hypothetical protein